MRVTQSLSKADQDSLALFYEQPSYKAMERLIRLVQTELAKDSLAQTDILQVRYLAGQVEGLNRLLVSLQENHKKYQS